MKKIINLMLLLLMVSSTFFAQSNCGSEPSNQYLLELDNEIVSKSACLDSFSLYDLNAPITFNLVLSYAKFGDGEKEFNQTDLDDIENNINDVYNDQNIYFNIIWNDMNCDACLNDFDNWPGYMVTTTCVQGQVLHPDITNASPFSGVGDISSGRFWSEPESVPHELGHAIGLLHTHSNDATATGYTSELVTRSNTDEEDSCSCNCLRLGDRVCDTPPDPRITNLSFPGVYIFNDAMFANCTMKNDSMVTDSCGDLFADPSNIVMNNVMSYHCDDQNSIPRMTAGQNLMIRRKMDNGDGKFKFQQDPSEPNFTQGLTVNAPKTISIGEGFNGDIVVNSDLTIQNCVVELTEGHKIIVNAGASLNISNATIRTYTGGICYFPMAGKKQWEGIEIVPSSGSMTNISVEANSMIDTSEVGIYNLESSEGLLNLAFKNSTLNGPAITLSNTLGIQKLFKSNFSSTVSVTDNFYLVIEGCNFNLPVNSEFSGIKARNTSVLVGHAYPDIPSKFNNCHTSVDFITESIHALAVVDAEFHDVLGGVSAHGAGGLLVVSDCSIHLRNANNIFGGATGIYNNNMMDFKIYNNEIYGANSNKEYGIELTTPSENANSNLLINNKIYDCSTGINSRVNSTDDYGDNMSGVEFECNQFFNIEGDNFKTSEIGPKQGREFVSPTNQGRSAGNVFDGSNTGFQEFNYVGGGFDLTKYYFRNATNEEPIYYNPDPHTGFNFDRFTTEIINTNPVCTYPVINNDPNQIPTVRTQVTGLYDGGNTDGVIKLVEDDSDHDPTAVITDIVINSPWVSVAVVQTVLEYAQYYTASEFAQVVLANPGVIVDPYIYDVVFDSGSMSNAMQLTILNAYNASDARIDFENSLTDIFLDGAVYSNGVIEQEIVNGTINIGVIRSEIDKKISKTKYYQVVETYLYEEDYASALLALTSKNDIRTKDPIVQAEKSVYAELVHMKFNLGSQVMNWNKLSTSDYNRVVQIANTYNGFATAKARNILKIYYGLSFGVYPPKPDYPFVTFLAAGTRSTADEARLNVYPNPTKEYINIDFISELDVTSSQIKLYTTKGEMILNTELNRKANKIDISSIPPGIYYYEILANEKSVLVDKIIVIK